MTKIFQCPSLHSRWLNSKKPLASASGFNRTHQNRLQIQIFESFGSHRSGQRNIAVPHHNFLALFGNYHF